MDWEKYFFDKNEKPLDNLVNGYSRTAIFRTIGCIGESLSSGEFEAYPTGDKPGGYDLFEYSWGQFIARKNGLKVYNFSRGGMTAKWYMESYAEEHDFWDKEKACQAYVIALGVNDIYNCKMEIGSISDINKDDYTKNNPTFVGYYAMIISRYKEISPDAKFFFVTFPKTPDANEDTYGMIKALYDLAKYFDNSYVIDLYKNGPKYDEKFRERFYLGNHLNPDGYMLTAELIDSYIDYIIRHNPDDFRNTAFINTDIKYK